jgi:hypothetical protein
VIDVGWDKSYNIDIRNVSGTAVFHMREALKKYLAAIPMPSGDDAVVAEIEKVMDACNYIVEDDEGD